MNRFLKKSMRSILFLLLLVALLPPISAEATSITLSFDSLPSAQGWTYNPGESSAIETNVFSVGGGLLHMDSINTGVGYSGIGYQLDNVVDPAIPFTITVVVRVTDYVVQSPNNPYGFSIALQNGSEMFYLGIAPGNIRGGYGDPLFSSSIDVSQFHEYRMEGVPGSGFQVFVDDVYLGFGASAPLISTNRLQLGDGTGGANAIVDISYYSFEQVSNQLPDCTNAVASTNSLWPPNHQLVNINIAGVTDPEGDPVTITVNGIFQDEPTNGTGDGDVAPDGFGIGSPTASVRAERSGNGNGRVYHIGYTATDSAGASCSGEVLVKVNHSKKNEAIDDGAIYDSTQ